MKRAQIYDGNFELDFLRPGEYVACAEPNGAAIVITGGTPDPVFVRLGEIVRRNEDGSLDVLAAIERAERSAA